MNESKIVFKFIRELSVYFLSLLIKKSLLKSSLASRINSIICDSPGSLSEFLTSHREQYARAREAEADNLAEDMLRIADNCHDAQKARVQIDTRKWLASKKNPKKFGDKLAQDITMSVQMTESELIEKIRADAKLLGIEIGDSI